MPLTRRSSRSSPLRFSPSVALQSKGAFCPETCNFGFPIECSLSLGEVISAGGAGVQSSLAFNMWGDVNNREVSLHAIILASTGGVISFLTPFHRGQRYTSVAPTHTPRTPLPCCVASAAAELDLSARSRGGHAPAMLALEVARWRKLVERKSKCEAQDHDWIHSRAVLMSFTPAPNKERCVQGAMQACNRIYSNRPLL